MKETLHVIREGKSDPLLYSAPKKKKKNPLLLSPLTSPRRLSHSLSLSRFPSLTTASSRVPLEHSGGPSCLFPLSPAT